MKTVKFRTSDSALCIYEKQGTLYEVHGSHCSCYRLEGQFELEEVQRDVLSVRLRDSRYGIMKAYEKKIRKMFNL